MSPWYKRGAGAESLGGGGQLDLAQIDPRNGPELPGQQLEVPAGPAPHVQERHRRRVPTGVGLPDELQHHGRTAGVGVVLGIDGVVDLRRSGMGVRLGHRTSSGRVWASDRKPATAGLLRPSPGTPLAQAVTGRGAAVGREAGLGRTI